jgi:glutamate 5-kinase
VKTPKNKQSIVIIKIGTNILTTPKGKLDKNNLKSLLNQIFSEYKKKTHKYIIVTSGAIACGSEQTKLLAKTIPEKQANAAVGQILLMQEYLSFFKKKKINIGQILLTKKCITEPTKKKNAQNTIFTLLNHNILPIINENDSVATDEIDQNFGDNDTLSSQVAKLVSAKQLILLTDIDGLFTANPKKDSSATLLKKVTKISDKILGYVDDNLKNTHSRGGMNSKILAAKSASKAGTKVIIANGRRANIIKNIFQNNFIGTTILPS